jgi:hypothetical protein
MTSDPQWTIDELRLHLQAAVEIERLVIPPYLCGMLSIHPGKNRTAALIVHSVVIEEMLHLTLAANVLNAVGGRPALADPLWAPRYPARIPYLRGAFALSILPFGDTALDAFLTIENPSYDAAEPIADDVEAAVPRLLTLERGEGTYSTIGAFYKAIEQGLIELVEELGEKAVFSGKSERQVGPEQYYAGGGRVIEVCNLQTARAALELIVEQGEGELTLPPSGEKFDPDRDLAHFYRFDELRRRRRYNAGDLPKHPTGEAIELDLTAVYPMKPDLRMVDLREEPSLLRLAERCNTSWSELLRGLDRVFDGRPELMEDAVVQMFALRDLAAELLRIPLPDGSGQHAGPTFEYIA